MKRVDFQRLRATNFKVYRDLSFDFEKLGPGCHAITGRNLVQPRLGSNGAGKSTLWDCLSFALTGRTTKRLRASDVQPYGTSADPVVTLEMLVDGTTYTIERHAVPHLLRINGKASVQDHLDNLLGIDLDLLLQTVILAQGAPLFLDLEPRFKLTLLSDVMHLERFDGYARIAQQQASDLQDKSGRLFLRREKVAGSIGEVGRQLRIVRSQLEEWQAAKRDELNELADALRRADHAATTVANDMQASRAHYDKLAQHEHAMQQRLTRAETQRNAGVDLKRTVSRLKERDDCPTCRQPVSRAAITSLHRHADQMIGESRYDTTLADYMKATNAAVAAQTALREFSNQQHEIERTAAQAEAQLAAAQVKVNPFTEQRHALQARLSELHKEERAVAAELEGVEVDKARVDPWVSGFRDIRLIVLDDMLATLSVLTTSYANDLGLACNVKFSIDRTAKSGATLTGIHCSVDAVEKFEAWSGGEAQRLRLAASLALAATLLTEAGISVNLLALDEPSAHLSPEGLNELVTFLSEHATAEGRVVYITDQRPLRLISSVLLERNDDNVVVK